MMQGEEWKRGSEHKLSGPVVLTSHATFEWEGGFTMRNLSWRDRIRFVMGRKIHTVIEAKPPIKFTLHDVTWDE